MMCKKHDSHVTRGSDSSLYDEVCVICGATDVSGGGWGKLAKPCINVKQLQECVDRADIFFDDVLSQIGGLCIQDMANVNELGILLRKLRS